MRPRRLEHPFTRRTKRKRLVPLLALTFVPISFALVGVASWFTYLTAHSHTTTKQSSGPPVVGDVTGVTADTNLSPPTQKQHVVDQEEKAYQEDTNIHSNDHINAVRKEFRNRYGSTAEDLYNQTVTAFGNLQHTAHRILQAASAQRPFVFGFAGYSVTVGRGNHYEESFPFQLQQVLQPLFQQTLNIDVTVRNAAIGGIPSFPYAFCFKHFLGTEIDVLSWDFSMNEGNTASVLESYLRHSQQLAKQPLLILLDHNRQRREIVKQYTTNQWIHDAIMVKMPKDVVDKSILELPEDSRPPGFQHWDEFGAPKNCPGRGSWHPKKMEHSFIGWMMSLRMVQALELALEIQQQDPAWKTTYGSVVAPEPPQFGAPISKVADNDAAVTDFLFGHTLNDDDKYILKPSSCRTNFLPAMDPNNVLPSIVVSGMSRDSTAANIMEPRSDDAYNSGWVLDVSQVERDTKVKVEQCGGLGYVDMKIALYGIPQAGPLKLWLPLEHESSHHENHDHGDTKQASHWFDDVIICEANEKRGANACKLDADISYTVGGQSVSHPRTIHGAAEYLKRPTCVHIGVPPDAVVTTLGELEISAEDRIRLAGPDAPDESIGLMVEIEAKTPVTRADGACCVSHVVWEQH